MRLLSALVFLLAALPASAACLNADGPPETVTGRLSLHHFRDPMNRREDTFILTLSAPACLTGTDDTDKVDLSTTMDVFSIANPLRARLKALVGRKVTVTGKPFGAITVHHHSPIVMEISAVGAATGR